MEEVLLCSRSRSAVVERLRSLPCRVEDLLRGLELTPSAAGALTSSGEGGCGSFATLRMSGMLLNLTAEELRARPEVVVAGVDIVGASASLPGTVVPGAAPDGCRLDGAGHPDG
jgi:hypothetical protein